MPFIFAYTDEDDFDAPSTSIIQTEAECAEAVFGSFGWSEDADFVAEVFPDAPGPVTYFPATLEELVTEFNRLAPLYMADPQGRWAPEAYAAGGGAYGFANNDEYNQTISITPID